MLNRCEFIGNVGKPPEMRQAGGQAVANFSVACNEKWKDKSGNPQERTEWVRCIAWGKLAEVCGQYLEKGRQVYVSGKMQTREWVDKENVKRYSTEIVIDTMKMLGKREGGGNDNGGGRLYEQPAGGVPDDDDVPF